MECQIYMWRESMDDLKVLEQELKKIGKKFKGEPITEESVQRVMRMAKNAFYQEFSPKIKDKYRPVFEFNQESRSFKFRIEAKNEAN